MKNFYRILTKSSECAESGRRIVPERTSGCARGESWGGAIDLRPRFTVATPVAGEPSTAQAGSVTSRRLVDAAPSGRSTSSRRHAAASARARDRRPRGRDQARKPRPGVLPVPPGRSPRRRRSRCSSSGRCATAHGPGARRGRRRALHAHRAVPRPDEARRGSAALERAARRDEPRRPAARGSGFVALHATPTSEILQRSRPASRATASWRSRRRARSSTRAIARSTTSSGSCPRRSRLDCLYATRRSFAGDLRILSGRPWPVLLRGTSRSTARRRLGRRAAATCAAYEGGRRRASIRWPAFAASSTTARRAIRDLREPRRSGRDPGRRPRYAAWRRTPRCCPKPLMPIGDRSILEILVHQLAARASRRHLLRRLPLAPDPGGLRQSRGQARRRSRTCVEEDEPLGTAAPLRLVDGLDETFLVMNGDVLTTLDYRGARRPPPGAAATFHDRDASRRVQIDYGVMHLDPDERTAARLVALRGEAGDRLERQHGHLRVRAAGARAHP